MTATRPPVVAAADWGTSNMRVWLLDAVGEVLAERRSDDGMARAQETGFGSILETHLTAMGAPAELPVVVCGMAGARQGWTEAGYLSLPARIADFARGAVRAPGIGRDVRILPGLAQASPPDVMRGEETQIAGAAERLRKGRHLLCLPGTHSKWVEVGNGAVTAFSTAMTGELFQLMSAQSILRHSIGASPAQPSPDDTVFGAWLDLALQQPQRLGSLLFRIRASSLLDDMPPGDAAAALSGLLIGTEIAAARAEGDDRRKIVLVASGALGALYEAALGLAGHAVERIDAEAAVRTGLFAAARRLFPGGSA